MATKKTSKKDMKKTTGNGIFVYIPKGPIKREVIKHSEEELQEFRKRSITD